jgi:hypothetical protein
LDLFWPCRCGRASDSCGMVAVLHALCLAHVHVCNASMLAF